LLFNRIYIKSYAMIERKGILIRLYPDSDQDILFRRTGGCVRLVKNVALEQRSMFGRPGRPITYSSQAAELAALKEEAPFLRDVPHHCLQQALVDLDRAFANFFAGRAKYPTRQRKCDGVSFRFPDPKQFRIAGDTTTPDKKRTRAIRDVVLHLPKAGAVRASMHRAIPEGAVIKSVTVRSSGDMWVASLLCEREIALQKDRSTGDVVGIDLGVCQPAATSSGAIHQLPRTTPRHSERERRLQRTVARRKKGSRNRAKAVRALARHKAKQARRRLDAREKLTTELAKNHGVVAMEGIDLKNMTKSARGMVEKPGKRVAQKSGLNRSLLDLGLGTTRLRLGQKLAGIGGVLLLVPQTYTSRRCNACGHIHADNRPDRDTFMCVACGHDADADVNAACNIRDYARGLWGDPAKVEVAASLPLHLASQAKAKRSFKKKAVAEGLSAPACGDLGASRSMKQETTSGNLGKMAA
jgi:putative transposase